MTTNRAKRVSAFMVAAGVAAEIKGLPCTLTLDEVLMVAAGAKKKLTKAELYDYRDIDPWEAKLIRVGHSLWKLLRHERRQKGVPLREIRAVTEAIETVVTIKRQYRAELKVKRAAESKAMQARFDARKLKA